MLNAVAAGEIIFLQGAFCESLFRRSNVIVHHCFKRLNQATVFSLVDYLEVHFTCRLSFNWEHAVEQLVLHRLGCPLAHSNCPQVLLHPDMQRTPAPWKCQVHSLSSWPRNTGSNLLLLLRVRLAATG